MTTAMFSSQLGILICLILWHTPATLQQNESSPIVDTKLGKIQGTTLISLRGSTIYAFRGIPYAQPPIKNLRFAAPQPFPAWRDTLNATRDALRCPQVGLPTSTMSEDCLTLNVYSRNLTGNSPVMVWIHGGANQAGSGIDSGPEYLLVHDIVMVAFNYRIGALGFVCTRTEEAPGNFAYLDQILVLKWVQDHIANFGGNPNLVTIYGVSSGAASVTLHMASPLSKGLFHRAIAMSGSATNNNYVDNLHRTRTLARDTSCPMYNPKDLLDCLREVSWETIINVSAAWASYGYRIFKWHYEIDGHFLEEHPTEIFRSGKYNSVPLLIGFAKNEYDFLYHYQENNTGLMNDISLNFGKYAPHIFMYNISAESQDPPVSQRLQTFYLGDSGGNVTKDNLNHFGEIMSDMSVGFPTRRLIDLLGSNTTVYYYRMDYQGQRGFYVDANGKLRGVGHADDVQYIMPGSYAPQLPLDHPDMFMVDRLTKWFTTFAKNGDPYTEDYEGPWTTADKGTLYIDRPTHLGPAPYVERYALWDELFPLEKSSGTTIQIKMYSLAIISIIELLKAIY